VLLTPLINILSKISQKMFEQILNVVPGKTDLGKKLEAENLMSDSL